MKKILFLLLIASLPLWGAVYTDSLGRSVEIPDSLERIVPSGSLSQQMLYSIAPERIVGLSSRLSGNAARYFDRISSLPFFGTFYGKSANLNREALIFSFPDIVIDIGEIKGSKDAMASDLDRLQREIATPVVFVEAYLEEMGSAYRTLGALLGNEEKAETLASFSDEALKMAKNARESIAKPVSVYYSSSADGLEAIPEGSFHGEVIEITGAKNVVPRALGSIVSVSMEQIYLWNPDVILLSDREAYENVLTSPLWATLDAVRNNRVYLIPSEPYSLIDNPPASNRILGVYWLGSILYPELYPVDIVEKTMEFYSLFYNYKLGREDAERILGM